MALKLVTAPAEEPLALDGDGGAKRHLRVEDDYTDEDASITGLIVAAREWCEKFQRRAYVTQTWELTLDDWPDGDRIRIPLPPLQAVVSIKYLDSEGTEYTLDPGEYIVDTRSEPGRVVLAYGKSWPSVTLQPAAAITIRFTAGYGAAAAVPKRAKQAMLLLIGHWFEHREAVLTGSISKKIELTVSSLLWQDRRFE